MRCLGFTNSAGFDRNKPPTVLVQKICCYSFTVIPDLAHGAAGVKPLPPSFQGNHKNRCGFCTCCREPTALTPKQDRQADLM